MAVVVAAVVVVILALLAGLYAAHVGPFGPSGSGGGTGGGGSGGSGETFKAAYSSANTAANGTSGGPWSFVVGAGLFVANPSTVTPTQLADSLNGTGCTAAIQGGLPSAFTFAATSGSPSSGNAEVWVMDYLGTNVGLDIVVIGGTAYVVLKITGPSCATLITQQHATLALPPGALDSPAIASAAWSAGGSAFASSHGGTVDASYVVTASITEVVSGVTHTLGANWLVNFTNCNIGGAAGTTLNGAAGSSFLASVNATSGASTGARTIATGCANRPGIGSVSGGGGGGGGGGGKHSGKPWTNASIYVGFGYQTSFSGGPYWNNDTASSNNASLHFVLGDFTITIENASTKAVLPTTGFNLTWFDNVNMTVYASYNFATNTWTDPSLAFNGSISAGFALRTPISMTGDLFVITATATAPTVGSAAVPIGA